MITISPDNFTNDELATCVDEFFKRIINSIRDSGIDKPIQLIVRTAQYSKENDYKIEHKALIGSEYGENHQSTTNNLMNSAHNAAARWLEDSVSEPVTVRPMITHQEPLTSVSEEEAQF